MNKYITVMDKYHITSERYELLFLYENIYGIFRPREFISDYRKSKYYDLIKTAHFDGDSLEDILKDLAFFVRAGRIELKANDVVAIKINGFLTSYRYCGLPCNLQGEHPEFIKVDNFLADEKERYINDIHKEKYVLNVLDAVLIPLDKLNLKQSRVYCIDKETFCPPDKSGRITSNYSLVALRKGGIANANPYKRPFVMMNNALYFFYRKKEHEKNAVLLFSKRELEMVKDYIDLDDVKLIILQGKYG